MRLSVRVIATSVQCLGHYSFMFRSLNGAHIFAPLLCITLLCSTVDAYSRTLALCLAYILVQSVAACELFIGGLK